MSCNHERRKLPGSKPKSLYHFSDELVSVPQHLCALETIARFEIFLSIVNDQNNYLGRIHSYASLKGTPIVKNRRHSKSFNSYYKNLPLLKRHVVKPETYYL